MKTTNHFKHQKMTFNQLFTQILPEEISDNVFKLVGKDFFAITAGQKAHYNSMIGSGGGLGMLFKKPVTWCVLRSDRYTLELMQKEQMYTLSYFPNEHREQMLFLGSKSGRDTDKMKEVELTVVRTPSGNISFEQARLVIECKLMQITMPGLADFYSREAKDYLNEAYKSLDDYRKYVWGEIVAVWIKR